MKARNLFKQIFPGSFWLGLSAVLITALVSFVGVTHGTQISFMEGENEITAELPALRSNEQQTSIPDMKGIGLITNYAGWKGNFHYKLEFRDGYYDGSTKLLEMEGLRGATSEDIEVNGNIVFTPAKGNFLFAGRGSVTYTIARMNLSGLGDARVVHFKDGKGSAMIKRNSKATYLRRNRAAGHYSFRIEPGTYEPDIDAFGVKVLTATEMKVTRAFIEKMESEERPVLYPEALMSMFPEYDWYPDRDHIVLEAFDMPLPKSGNVLTGSYTDEKGGVLSWKFVAF